jgi:hypothetical protein
VESNKDTEDKKKEIPRYRWPRFTRSALWKALLRWVLLGYIITVIIIWVNWSPALSATCIRTVQKEPCVHTRS